MATDDVITQWWIDGAWTDEYAGIDLADRVRKSPGVEIARGVSDSQAQFTPASSQFDVNSRDGLFSNRYPGSPLRGKIGRFTQVRHLMPDSNGDLDSYIRFFPPDSNGPACETADKAGIEITGDIDIRFEFTPDTWIPVGGYAIAGKYLVTGNQRSWIVWMEPGGYFVLRWSTDGTSTAQVNFAQWPTGFYDNGRQIVRITLDVNNGASGRTATLYQGTGDITSGPWTQIDQVVQSGTTSIYGSGTADLELGNVGNSGSPITGQTQLYGKLHHFQLYSGIAGSLVAEMNPKTRDVGDTSWSDGLGNTWTVTSPAARVGSDRIRHVGEMDRIDYRRDTSGRDNWLPMKTLGPLARMQEAGQPIRSPIYRQLIAFDDVYGYWPMEEASGAAKALSQSNNPAYAEHFDTAFTGSIPDGLPGASGCLTLTSADSYVKLGAAGRDNPGGQNTFLWYYRLAGGLPASDKPLVTLQGNGTVKRWVVNIGPGGYRLQGYTSSGLGPDHAVGFGTGASPVNGAWVGIQLTLAQEGANVRYTWRWYGIESGLFWEHVGGGSTYAGTVGLIGRPTIDAGGETAFAGSQFAHAVLSRDSFDLVTTTFRDMAIAYNGELSGNRAVRLAGEEGIELEMRGDPADTQPMGYQTPSTPYFLLEECAKVDNGILGDVRDRFAIFMRTRVDMENMIWNSFLVDWSEHEPSEQPAPVEDGAFTRNDMTITGGDGSVGRFTQTEGPLSTAEPPDGIGFRPGTDSVNSYSADQVQRLTEYQVFLRTRDEFRIPALPFEMHRTAIETGNPFLAERLRAMDLGDWMRLYKLPDEWDPNPRYMTAIGYAERFDGFLWRVAPNLITADGFRTPTANYIFLADDGTTTLGSDIDDNDTSAVFVTPVTSRPWIPTSHAEWPGDITARIGGEVIVATTMGDPSVVGSDWQQTATITRGANTGGVGYAHAAGTVIELNVPFYLGLNNA